MEKFNEECVKNRKKVLFVRALKGYPDSRLEKEVYSLSKKYDVCVLGWNRDEDYKGIREVKRLVFGKEVSFYQIGIKAPVGKGFSKLFFPMLKYWVREYQFLINQGKEIDFIHACDFDTALIAYIASKRMNKKLIYDIFDYYSESHKAPNVVKYIIKYCENQIITRAEATLICSEQRRNQIREASPRRLAVIHNTPIEMNLSGDNGCKLCTNEDSAHKVKLVYIGLLSEDRFLKEIGNVIAQRNDVEWHIGGWGALTDYFEKVSASNSNIFFYGSVSYESALALEMQTDIMTAIYDPGLPNHKYAAPNKFYEALMIKKPLIMIQGTGMDEYVREYQIGEVIDLASVDFEKGFEEALDRLVCAKAEWSEMGERGYGLYSSKFAWGEMEKRLWNIYETV